MTTNTPHTKIKTDENLLLGKQFS